MAATTIAQEISRLTTAKADIKTAIEGKGVTVPSSTLLDGYADLVDQIQQGGAEEAPENDVNFYDYDGFRVASYTIAEAKALTALPTPPTHEGLTFQEWNWTLSDIQGYNRQYVDIGANYITTDGNTYIIAKATNNEVYVRFQARKGLITVDWGDGTPVDSYDYTGIGYSAHNFSHTYQVLNVYKIKISFAPSATNGLYFLDNSNTYTNLVVSEIRFGGYIDFYYVQNLQNIFTSFTKVSIPATDTFTRLDLQSDYIDTFVVPRNSSIVFTKAQVFRGRRIVFPKSITTFGQSGYSFYQSSLSRLVVPEYTTTTPLHINTFASLNCSIISIPSCVTFASDGNNINVSMLFYLDIAQGWTPNKNMNFNGSTYWNADAIVAFFTKLGTTSTAITLTFGSTNLAKLTEEQKAIATSKGYTLA